MKILAIAAAAAVMLAGASAASAQTMHARTTVVERSSTWHGNGPRHDRWRWKTVCTTKWRGHHKIRTCRKVRVRW